MWEVVDLKFGGKYEKRNIYDLPGLFLYRPVVYGIVLDPSKTGVP